MGLCLAPPPPTHIHFPSQSPSVITCRTGYCPLQPGHAPRQGAVVAMGDPLHRFSPLVAFKESTMDPGLPQLEPSSGATLLQCSQSTSDLCWPPQIVELGGAQPFGPPTNSPLSICGQHLGELSPALLCPHLQPMPRFWGSEASEQECWGGVQLWGRRTHSGFGVTGGLRWESSRGLRRPCVDVGVRAGSEAAPRL